MNSDAHVTNHFRFLKTYRLTTENKQLNSLDFCMFVWASIQNLKNSSRNVVLISFLGQI